MQHLSIMNGPQYMVIDFYPILIFLLLYEPIFQPVPSTLPSPIFPVEPYASEHLLSLLIMLHASATFLMTLTDPLTETFDKAFAL